MEKSKIPSANDMYKESLAAEKALIPVREQERIANQAKIREKVLAAMQTAKENGKREVAFDNIGGSSISSQDINNELIEELRNEGHKVTVGRWDSTLYLGISWDKSQGIFSRAKERIFGKSDSKER